MTSTLSTDERVISEGIDRAIAGRTVLDDLTARVIAAGWHGGQSSPLYALASSGAISPSTLAEIAQTIELVDNVGAVRELAYLALYVAECGPRGPVQGWSDLTW